MGSRPGAAATRVNPHPGPALSNARPSSASRNPNRTENYTARTATRVRHSISLEQVFPNQAGPRHSTLIQRRNLGGAQCSIPYPYILDRSLKETL